MTWAILVSIKSYAFQANVCNRCLLFIPYEDVPREIENNAYANCLGGKRCIMGLNMFIKKALSLMQTAQQKIKYLANCIGHYQQYHHTLCLSLQILDKHCFQFLLGATFVPRENKNNAYAKFGGKTISVMVFFVVANFNYHDIVVFQHASNVSVSQEPRDFPCDCVALHNT